MLEKLNSEDACLNVLTLISILIAVFGITAGIITHSTALLLDGSLAIFDIIAVLMILLAVKFLQNSASNKRYPYGYFKMEPLIIAMQAVFIIALCLMSVLHALKDMLHHTIGLKNYGWGYAYTLFTIAVSLFAYLYIVFVNRKVQSPFLKLAMLSWLYGLLLTAGLLLGFLLADYFAHSNFAFLRTLSLYMDGIMVLGVVVYIIKKPVLLFIENLDDLMDRQARDHSFETKIYQSIQEAIRLQAKVFVLDTLKVRRAGRAYFVSLSYFGESTVTLEEVQHFNEMVRQQVQQKDKHFYLEFIPKLMTTPAFPEFRVLTVADRVLIEKVTQHFRPATVFNLINLIAWNSAPCEISFLNQNIVLKTQGFFMQDVFFSLLGETKLIESITTLFKYLEESGQEQKLHLIPEEMLHFEPKIEEYFNVEEEKGYSNYVYLLEKFRAMAGTKMHTHRKNAHYFKREYPEAKIEIMEFDPNLHQKMIEKVFVAWESLKHKSHSDNQQEWQAVQRFCDLATELPSYIVILRNKEEVLGFCIFELMQQQFIIAHFLKVLPLCRGGEDVIFHEIAEAFFPKGYRYFNTEDDFDIELLRNHKLHLHPEFFIKQYAIYPRVKLS